ncbi:ead/Ea22-like family protein [Enterobacter hormaechei]|uniref:ead/Ea22-like family protein n=1 Tax=Enterobacter hormaechei TaxID=158836 RepID=UPI000F81FA73|nr:ead/Ea22-like family protein [Enterobacter hormaechei]RTP45009.1 ead/Ea22-like family protein [Enterobacter hormaechei]
MSNIDKQALRDSAESTIGILENIAGFEPSDIDGDAVELRFETEGGFDTGCDVSIVDQCQKAADVVRSLLDELEAAKSYAKERDEENQDLMLTVGRLRVEKEAAERRIAKLSASHGKLREAMAGIHNIIRGEGAYTPLAAILNASKRAYEESAAAAGKGE